MSSSTPGDSVSPAGVQLSAEDVRRIAKLARLELTEEQVAEYGPQLAAVLGHMDQLRAIQTGDVEPMTHPGARTNALDEDAPRAPSEVLPVQALLNIAPETMDHFVRVPKVIGEGAA